MIEIDGGQKSGSGTIVRDAISLAVLIGQEVHLTNIRARREVKGKWTTPPKKRFSCANDRDEWEN